MYFIIMIVNSICNASEPAYKPFDDVDVSLIVNDAKVIVTHDNQNVHIKYDVWTMGASGYNPEWINEQIQRDSSAVFEFAKMNKLPLVECRYYGTLEIYLITDDLINDKSKFNGYLVTQPDADKIWGLFDAYDGSDRDGTPEKKNDSALLLTWHNAQSEMIFAHELFHYWNWRMCWLIPSENEKMAMEFEEWFEHVYRNNGGD